MDNEPTPMGASVIDVAWKMWREHSPMERASKLALLCQRLLDGTVKNEVDYAILALIITGAAALEAEEYLGRNRQAVIRWLHEQVRRNSESDTVLQGAALAGIGVEVADAVTRAVQDTPGEEA